MANTTRFTKMHGCGNDYIYVDIRKYPIQSPEATSIIWSDRHKGIGGDGLVLIGSSEKADYSMRIFNSDGLEARMCGNASRCVAKFLYDNGDLKKEEFTLETLSGIISLKIQVKDSMVESVTVDLGKPVEIKEVDLGEEYPFNGIAVNMGNPHLVILVDDLNEIDLSRWGSRLEYHPLFPDRINVEFAQVINNNTIRMRVWERGSGITQACGTGASATVVAASYMGKAAPQSNVIMDGGMLKIEWDKPSGSVYMIGPAITAYEGEVPTP